MATSIPISGLNAISVITSSDFIPIVQSSSITTYRVPIDVFGEWISDNVTVSSSLSSSWVSSSVSSSYAETASFSFLTDNLNYPNTSTASYTISVSYSFFSTSASYALRSTSASYALRSTSASFATSASWAPVPISASWASRSFNATNALFASQSFSSSYALSASYSFSSSNANTASYVSPSIIGPKFFNITVSVDAGPSGGNRMPYFTYDASLDVPGGTTAIILQFSAQIQSVVNEGLVQIRKNSSSPWLLISSFQVLGFPVNPSISSQGTFPIDSDGTFQYRITMATGGPWTLDMVGYY